MKELAKLEKKAVAVSVRGLPETAMAHGYVRFPELHVVTDPVEIAVIKARVDADREAEHRQLRRSVRRRVCAWITRAPQPQVW